MQPLFPSWNGFSTKTSAFIPDFQPPLPFFNFFPQPISTFISPQSHRANPRPAVLSTCDFSPFSPGAPNISPVASTVSVLSRPPSQPAFCDAFSTECSGQGNSVNKPESHFSVLSSVNIHEVLTRCSSILEIPSFLSPWGNPSCNFSTSHWILSFYPPH